VWLLLGGVSVGVLVNKSDVDDEGVDGAIKLYGLGVAVEVVDIN
jgi:hypothetical protein